MMMHDIQHTLSPETAQKLFVLWQSSYKHPFLKVFNNEAQIRETVDPNFAVSQLFILISAYLDSPVNVRQENLEKAIQLFFHGVLK